MEESAQNTFEYFCAAAFNFGVRRTARIVHEVQIASKFRIPGIFLTYIGNRMIVLNNKDIKKLTSIISNADVDN